MVGQAGRQTSACEVGGWLCVRLGCTLLYDHGPCEELGLVAIMQSVCWGRMDGVVGGG